MKTDHQSSYTRVNTEEWGRKKQFELFRSYADPFFNITTHVDVTGLISYAKKQDLSRFLALLHLITEGVNAIQEFRYRLDEKGVVEYDVINPGCTILNSDTTFRFCYFDFVPDLSEFVRQGEEEIAREPLDSLDPRWLALEFIHCSVVPWTSFTAIKHARREDALASIPKITLGKYFERGNRIVLPISIEAHHALVDGYHVGQYLEYLERASSRLEF